MAVSDPRYDIPVLLLHNIDPCWLTEEIEEAVAVIARLEKALQGVGHPVTNVSVTADDLPRRLDPFPPERFVVFNWCEELPGIPHSDALVARILRMMGFTFTGSPSSVLELSWDKEKVKRFLEQNGLPTPYWRVYRSSHSDGWNTFPAIVKPAFEHCSFGVTPEAVVMDPGELRNRIEYVLEEFRQAALVEEFIDGREFHVSIWGNDSVEMLPPAEMDFSSFGDVHDRLCTYEAKFQPGSVPYEQIRSLLPAPLTDEEYMSLQRICLSTYRAYGCRDYARFDLRLRDGVFFILDINPNPDISFDASMACAAESVGISYGDMGSRLVCLAARRHPVFGKLV